MCSPFLLNKVCIKGFFFFHEKANFQWKNFFFHRTLQKQWSKWCNLSWALTTLTSNWFKFNKEKPTYFEFCYSIHLFYLSIFKKIFLKILNQIILFLSLYQLFVAMNSKTASILNKFIKKGDKYYSYLTSIKYINSPRRCFLECDLKSNLNALHYELYHLGNTSNNISQGCGKYIYREYQFPYSYFKDLIMVIFIKVFFQS